MDPILPISPATTIPQTEISLQPEEKPSMPLESEDTLLKGELVSNNRKTQKEELQSRNEEVLDLSPSSRTQTNLPIENQ